MSALRLDAPAKLNLSLRVVARRQDGLHQLDGVMVLLELADQLLLLPGASGLRVDASGDSEIPVDGTNLAWRGLVAAAGNVPDLPCLTLAKRIPSAAGLGGGSSDAAAAWRLGRRWRTGTDGVEPNDLVTLSAVGADVPFFAAAVAAARVRGIGEQVDPIRPAEQAMHAILVHPPVRLSTAAVFAELRRSEWSGVDPSEDPGPAEPGPNDLLAPARRLQPDIDDLFRLVLSAGGVPHLTGSGPTVYTLTDDPERAAAVAGRLRRAGLRVTETRLRREPASIETVSEEEQDG